MPTTDAKVDAYIAKAALFAQPVLTHLRAVVHAACPSVVESTKWGMPFFTYQGKNLAHMAAFKAHASFGFWMGERVAVTGKEDEGMGLLGRITSVKDLPPKRDLMKMVKDAMALIDAGAPSPLQLRAARGKAKPALEVPEDFSAALKRNVKARKTFEGFPPGKQRDYVAWITEAKREATRESRITQSIQWLAEGKSRNWKYEAC